MIIGQEHIVHAEEIVGRDVLVGVDGDLDGVGDDVGGVVGNPLGAVDRQLVAVNVGIDGKYKLDIARSVRLRKRLGDLDARGRLTGLKRFGDVNGLPIDAVLAGLDQQTAGQADGGRKLVQEAARKRADRALPRS